MREPRLVLFLYRLLLRLYPAQFREDYQREVLAAFAREWSKQPGLPARIWYFITVATAVLTDAPREHLAMLTSDLRHAFRRFLRSPCFNCVAFLSWRSGWGSIRRPSTL